MRHDDFVIQHAGAFVQIRDLRRVRRGGIEMDRAIGRRHHVRQHRLAHLGRRIVSRRHRANQVARHRARGHLRRGIRVPRHIQFIQIQRAILHDERFLAPLRLLAQPDLLLRLGGGDERAETAGRQTLGRLPRRLHAQPRFEHLAALIDDHIAAYRRDAQIGVHARGHALIAITRLRQTHHLAGDALDVGQRTVEQLRLALHRHAPLQFQQPGRLDGGEIGIPLQERALRPEINRDDFRLHIARRQRAIHCPFNATHNYFSNFSCTDRLGEPAPDLRPAASGTTGQQSLHRHPQRQLKRKSEKCLPGKILSCGSGRARLPPSRDQAGSMGLAGASPYQRLKPPLLRRAAPGLRARTFILLQTTFRLRRTTPTVQRTTSRHRMAQLSRHGTPSLLRRPTSALRRAKHARTRPPQHRTQPPHHQSDAPQHQSPVSQHETPPPQHRTRPPVSRSQPAQYRSELPQ